MAIMRLVPSTYYLPNATYLRVTDYNNMYDDTDSTTYATVTNSQTGTTSYYIYLRGFNFDDIPSNAIVNSISIKLKARESGISTSTSYSPKLCHGTSVITSTCSAISTDTTVYTFSGYSVDFDDIKAYGDSFGIRINCRRASRNTTGYMYIYGAEIEVDYTIPDPRTVTTSLTGDGTIVPEGVTNTYKDSEFTLTITPDNTSDEVSVSQDGTNVTSHLVPYYPGERSTFTKNLGTYSLISGSFSGSGETYFSGRVGKGDDASTTTSNYYSSSSSTNAVFQYDMSVTGLPANAVIERVYVKVSGHAESTSQASEYMCAQLKSGNVDLTERLNFKLVGTSNSVQTLETDNIPTVAQLSSMVLECTLGYYGGAINGATVYVEYYVQSGSDPEYYTYSFIVSSNTVIVVTIGARNALFAKNNGTYIPVIKAYKKINGVYVQQSDLTTVFQSGIHYIKGELPPPQEIARNMNSVRIYGPMNSSGDFSSAHGMDLSSLVNGSSYRIQATIEEQYYSGQSGPYTNTIDVDDVFTFTNDELDLSSISTSFNYWGRVRIGLTDYTAYKSAGDSNLFVSNVIVSKVYV